MRTVLLPLTLLLAALACPALADQNDPRLDALFRELHRTEDPGKAAFLQAGIWHVWYWHEDAAVRDLMSEGVRALTGERYAEAVKLFSRLIEMAPDYAEAWNRRATTYYLMGRYADSLADIDRVLELEPRHFGALSGRGLCLRDTGDLEGAVAALRQALAVNPHLEEVQLEIIRLEARLHEGTPQQRPDAAPPELGEPL